MKPAQIVTVKSKIEIFKDSDVAERIELIQLEETGFEIVSQKGLYEIGDLAMYIQPDFCLPENSELFESFTAPGGDPNKSRLGKGNRIRALKFNFHRGDGESIYSMGILIPLYEVISHVGQLPIGDEDYDYSELLGVFKYEEPETGKSGQIAGDMPMGMYKTDENNFENIKNKIEYPITLIGTLKVDGSSITCFVDQEGREGICSRTFEKKLDQSIVIGYEDADVNKLRKHFDKENMVRGWMDDSTNEFFTEVPDRFNEILGKSEDSWVKLGTPVLEKIKKIYDERGVAMAVRGEIVGEGLKGSGNKNNPHAKLKQQMLVFGIDDYSNGVTKKMDMETVIKLCSDLEIETVPVIFNKTFNSEQELRDACNEYFKENFVEGIVLRTFNAPSTKSLSTKYMNLEYDSKK